MTIYASDGTTQTPAPDVDAPTDAPTAPAEPATEVIDPEVVDPEPDNDTPTASDSLPAVLPAADPVTVPGQKWVHQSPWTHDWLEFYGDKLAVRIPKPAALVALDFARYRSDEAMEQMFGRFIAQHVSDETFARVLHRMSDPDEEQYPTAVLGELAKVLSEIAGERLKKDAEALAAVKNGKARKGK